MTRRTRRRSATILGAFNLAFRVKIVQANSASAWVAGSGDDDTSVAEGRTKALSGAAQNAPRSTTSSPST